MSENVEKQNWIKEMIEREAIPKPERKESVVKFAERFGISESTYKYQKGKPENQKKIVDLCLLSAKESLPEVLAKLNENAIAGKEKSMEMYLKFITGLAEKLDIKTDDISDKVKTEANKIIKEFLNGNSEDITKRQQGDDKSSIPVQSEEH